MKLLQMGDSSVPPAERSNLPIYAFYGGGETPHVWSDAEVEHIDSRWALPIWVCIDGARNGASDADSFAMQLAKYGWSKNVAVCLDTEDQVMPDYITRFDHAIQAHGYVLVHYESQSVDGENPPTTGGRWIARWPGRQDLPPGCVGNQYMNAQEANKPWDCSVFSSAVPLHEVNPVVGPSFIDQHAACILPVVRIGDYGYSVRALQSLLTAALPDAAGQAMSDGQFGPITQGWVGTWQHLYGVPDPYGVAGAATWESLLTRS